MALSGVRSSCEMVARNSSLACAGGHQFAARGALGGQQAFALGFELAAARDVAQRADDAAHAAVGIGDRRGAMLDPAARAVRARSSSSDCVGRVG